MVLFLILLIFGTGAISKHQGPFDRAQSYYDKGQNDLAIAEYNKILAKNPDDYMAITDRGNAYLAKGQSDQAIADYNQTIKLKPDFADPYNNIGYIYLVQGRYDDAIRFYNIALEHNPKFVLALSGRGSALLAEHEYDKAIDDLARAWVLDPKNKTLYQTLEKAAQDRQAAITEAKRKEESRGYSSTPSYDWQEESDRKASQSRDSERDFDELNRRNDEQNREADRQRQLEDQQMEWSREQQRQSQEEYRQEHNY
jgi:tetratricopeptide (TPR) repeat protein